MPSDNPHKPIQSIQRAIDILNCFQDVQDQLSLSEISERLNIKKSTVHGILTTLYDNNYLKQTPSRKYMLGYGITNKFLHSRSLNRSILLEESRDILKELTQAEEITSSLYVVEEGSVFLVHREVPEKGLYVINMADDPFNVPLYCTASGKLYLAHLSGEALNAYLQQFHQLAPFSPNTITSKAALKSHLAQIRQKGFSLENGELAEGISALALPILEPRGLLFATVSVTSVSSYIQKEEKILVETLKLCARKITQRIFGKGQAAP